MSFEASYGVREVKAAEWNILNENNNQSEIMHMLEAIVSRVLTALKCVGSNHIYGNIALVVRHNRKSNSKPQVKSRPH